VPLFDRAPTIRRLVHVLGSVLGSGLVLGRTQHPHNPPGMMRSTVGAGMGNGTRPETGATPAHGDAMASLQRLRTADGRMCAALVDGPPIAPLHMDAVRALDAGARSLAQLADATELHPVAVSALVDRLVTTGLVSRTPDPDDRRHRVMRLTETGQAVANRFHAVDRALADRVLPTMTAAEATLLATLLARVAGAATQIAQELDLDPRMLDGYD
jgi:DNA-binding MarR family transcriptional regulator